MHEALAGAFPTLKACRRVASFGKLESYYEFKELRWINSRIDAFKVFSGRFFKAIEDVLYLNPWFIKHVPVPERPSLIKALYEDGLFFYENDFKAFESHFRKEFMEACECRLYTHCLQKYPLEAAFINKVITGKNNLRTRAGINVSVEARRMSGDMCTSLGNGFSNLMIVLYLVDKMHGQVKGFVEGDDGLFASTVPLTTEDYASLGFTVEIHQISHPCKGHFCGNTCTEDGTVIKDPRRVFQNFGWTHSYLGAGNHIMDQLLRFKALSLVYELPQCPIVGVLARTALNLTEGLEARSDGDVWHSHPSDFIGPTGPFNPTEASRALVEELFHITRETQLLAEAAIMRHDMVAVSQLIPPNDDNFIYSTRYIETG